MIGQGSKPDNEYVRRLKNKPPKLDKESRLVLSALKDPVPPANLKGEGLQAWERMCVSLKAAGILFDISRDKLARYCQAWAQYSAVIDDENAIPRKYRYRPNMGNILEYKYRQAVKMDCERVMQDFEKQYGLTPASATQIRRPMGNGANPEDELDEFLEEHEEQDKA